MKASLSVVYSADVMYNIVSSQHSQVAIHAFACFYNVRHLADRRPQWVGDDYDEILRCVYEKPKKITVMEVIENSEKFPVTFPIEAVRCKTLIKDVPENILEEHINSVYPVVHEHTLNLYARFLIFKRKFGSDVEKCLYKNLTIVGLVDRLLTKRAVVFVGRHDRYMLLDGFARVGGWEKIGTSEEEDPLLLKDCLSYDEIKLSALLSVSSSTNFINIGNRDNCGKTERDLKKIESNGIIVGLIGARLEKPDVMEYQELVVTKDQITNKIENRDTTSPVVEKPSSDLFTEQPKTQQMEVTPLNNLREAIRYVLGVYLMENLIQPIKCIFYGPEKRKGLPATEEEASKETFLTTKQLFLDFYGNQLKYDPARFSQLRNGAYFDDQMYERRMALSIDTLLIEANARAKAANKMAYIHVVGIGLGVWKISPHQEALFMNTFAKRIGSMNQMFKKANFRGLVVASYAWDGNALPGNEFWMGQLTASGDPAAASSTQIAELHNPHINPRLRGAQLRIATLQGLFTLGEYIERLKNLPKKL
ncbi:hypothetical protein NQ318_005446 [Aromia moschata]|uniref:Uncharacterized protein n=1 Tax=Aromia moschata TaxID=1265417 RepID=A0AAV8YWI1_9CUCU|nr:hypothetical protein NQ318_005446 [Aromia moschata]